MYFCNEVHRENYLKLLEIYPKAWNDVEYRGAIYIIAHPEIFEAATTKKWRFPFGHVENGQMVSWVDNENFSIGITYLVELGQHLYNCIGHFTFSLTDAILVWDEETYRVFLQALDIRKGASFGSSYLVKGLFHPHEKHP